ncbi:MAG: cadherin-like beta sandwich domain-containing protein [Fastidiosipila sp.]|nr:cadherin-like beta sandwich domain-containing protein [Fastidiosipila sp.]HPX93450.1 cadherin-like beta sandwich domain-containing protein [Bacillota bacterium]
MRITVLLFTVMLILLSFAPSAFAQEVRTTLLDIAMVTEDAIHLFTIGWERGELSATLIAPDGTRIPQDDPPDGVLVATSEQIIIFRVENPQKGLWKAELKEFDNGRVGIITEKLYLPLIVEKVTARQEGSDILVDFSIKGDKNKTCSYDVYLTLDGQYQKGRLLQSGASLTGEQVSLRCPGKDVSSYEKWQVTVYAECETNGFTDFHSASSLPFVFANPEAPGLVRDLKAFLHENGVRAEWQPPDETITGYLAVLYDANDELIHSVTLKAEETQAQLPFFDQELVKIAISSIREGICGLPNTLLVNADMTLASLVGFSLPDQPATSNGYIELAYDTGGKTVPLSVDLDGQQSDRTLTGDGVLRLPVHNGTNRITVSAEGDNGVWVSERKTYMLDLIAPTLRIFVDWDAIVTSKKKILLSGNASQAQVTVNGETVETKDNGNFSKEVPLDYGINLLKVTATNDSGNTTTYEAHVTRRDLASSFPWWLLGGLLAAALVVPAYALSNRRRRSK